MHCSGPARGCSGLAVLLGRAEDPRSSTEPVGPCGALASTRPRRRRAAKVVFSQRPYYGSRFGDVQRRLQICPTSQDKSFGHLGSPREAGDHAGPPKNVPQRSLLCSSLTFHSAPWRKNILEHPPWFEYFIRGKGLSH